MPDGRAGPGRPRPGGGRPPRRHRGADKLATECVVNLIRTQSMLATELKRRFRRHGLTGAGFNVLATVDTPGRPHLVPVGFRLGLDDGS